MSPSKLPSCLVLFSVLCSAVPALGQVTFLNTWGSEGTGNGQFDYPVDVAVGPTGRVYVADYHNERIQRFDADGTYQTKWGSHGTGNGQFRYGLWGVAVAPTGQVYVVDKYSDRIQRFDADGTYQTKWGSYGGGNGQFNDPTGVAVTPTGLVYVADKNNGRIQRFDANGVYQTQWGSSAIDVAVGPTGLVYVAGGNGIQRFDAGGTYQPEWDTGNAQFNDPCGVAVAGNGLVYVADTYNDRIQRFDADGTYQTKWGSEGTGNGQFNWPKGVAVAPTGLIYVSDSNDRIQRFFDPAAWSLDNFIVDPDDAGGESFTVVTGMNVNVPGYVTVASDSAAALAVENQGSLASVGRLLVGEHAPGTLNVSGGGTLSTQNYCSIGRYYATGNRATVTGAGSTLGTGTNLYLGSAVEAELKILDGGTVNVGQNAYLASTSTGTGDAKLAVADAGSSLNVGTSLYIGGYDNAPGGTGEVSVTGGAMVDVGSTLKVWHDGTLRLTGGTVHAANADISGNVDPIGHASHLDIDGTTTLASALSLDGGTFSTGSLVNPEYLQFTSGTFNLTGDNLRVGSTGLLGSTIVLSSPKTLNVTNATTIDASGELELDGGTFSSGTLINHGLIGGDGRVDAPLLNAADGTVRALTGENQRFTGSDHVNYGDIQLLGGAVEFSGHLTNETEGLITGNGSLIAHDGTLNFGTVGLSATANLTGDITNTSSGLIISAGGTSTFFDDVANHGEIRTSLNSFSVFYGSLTGSGSYTGPGSVLIEGDLKPGSSPGLVEFGGDLLLGAGATLEIELGGLDPADYDRVNVDGTFAPDGMLDVVLINSFTPELGDSFEIFDFDACTGEFGDISLPGLSGGLVWDTSMLYTSGNLMVTPEPSSLVLLAAGALTLLLIRRRRN